MSDDYVRIEREFDSYSTEYRRYEDEPCSKHR
jgi:hypothetical protein